MNALTREARLLRTFAMLADTLVDDYDVVDLLQTLVDACHEHLAATAAGILLADPDGELELIASTSEGTRLVETMQLAAQAGPCIECFRTGKPVSVPDMDSVPEDWSAFRDSAVAQGFLSVDAIPLRLRDITIGTLNLMRSEVGGAPEEDLLTARAFADVATIGILHERTLQQSEALTQQLELALSTRIVIEQAKGVVAFTNNVPIDEAFELMRKYARNHGLRISDVAGQLVRRELQLNGNRT